MLTIDLAAISQNYMTLQEIAGHDVEMGVAVKANAYGLGVDEIAPLLYDKSCRLFYVATLQEGIDLRTILPQMDATIAILNGLESGVIPHYLSHHLTPVLCSLDEIKYWNINGQSNSAMIQFDIGMNRLGLSHADAQQFIESIQLFTGNFIPSHIIGHFTSADNPDEIGATSKQVNRYESICTALHGAWKNTPKFSLSNSGGIMQKIPCNSVRTGIALYGGHLPIKGGEKIKPVVTLMAKVRQIRAAESNQTVGYDQTHTLQRPSTLATVSIGYADGLFRSLSNNGHFIFRGQFAPILGRVSMDLTTIDVTDMSENPKVGDYVEIIGSHQLIDDFAISAGTISYEILTALGKRCDRVYKK